MLFRSNIHPNNIKRVVRAIEYCIQTNTKFSEHNEIESKRQSPYLYAYFVLTKNRDELYHAINQRVDAMTEMGLVSEVEQLLQQGCTIDMVSMKGLGYKEIIGALNGQYSIEDAFHKLKQETRHFAKRQLTWFRRERDVIWEDKSKHSEDEILQHILQILKEKGIGMN